MINIKPFVTKALKETGIPVSYFYPENFINLPLITYYETNNSTIYSYNNEDILAEISYAVDIWNKGSTTEIFRKVDEKMMGLGFRRISAQDLPEVETQINHKSILYSGKITKNLFMYN